MLDLYKNEERPKVSPPNDLIVLPYFRGIFRRKEDNIGAGMQELLQSEYQKLGRIK